MMEAQDCENLLLVQAEFDGELDAAEAARALHHRETCAICRAAYESFEITRAQLRQSGLYRRAPEQLRRALVAGFDTTPPRLPKSAPWWREGASFVLGASLAAGIALLILAPAQQSLIDQVVASHVRALQPGHLTDVPSSDQHTVKPWFDGRLDFAPPVKDFKAEDFPLLGGRLDYVNGRPVAALAYQRGKHLIDLFIWPTSGGAASLNGIRNGYNVVHWTSGGMTFWAVSDVELSSLRDFAQLWQSD